MLETGHWGGYYIYEMLAVGTIDDAERRFNSLVDRHQKLIRNLCWFRSFMHDEYYCADLVQRCYLAIWRHLHELPSDIDRKREAAWVAWRCRSEISHRTRHRPPDWVALDPSMAASLADDRRDDDIRETLEQLAVGLNERERRYLQLNNEGYSAEEIARLMQTTTPAVYMMRRRVIQKMRDTYNRINNNDKKQ